MTDGIQTLDELLSDPMVQLVMARDRVRPEELRLLFKRAERRAVAPSLPPAHVIEACRAQRLCI
ncbi:hypothetical protein SAMN04488498_105123 [Mesorhizobium albiziae]|uniref:Uncharacterized protein n=1 Tax=Neomesorhizobium albiziae TaxID=335020 RepID=A0A1I3YSX0_9HYPH|nr:hypothetical protein [Mesorhizobium albiziae]SFK34449.1 hypothetical protein SAMN04488498_105123 [Mesorhizobium albiziae]